MKDGISFLLLRFVGALRSIAWAGARAGAKRGVSSIGLFPLVFVLLTAFAHPTLARDRPAQQTAAEAGGPGDRPGRPDVCYSIEAFGARATPGYDNAPAIKAAYDAAGTSGKGCVDIPGGQYDTGPMVLDHFNNVAFFCRGPSTRAQGGSKLRALTPTTTMITIANLGGVSFRDCAFTSTAQQTAGSYLRIVGSNMITCDRCTFDRGYDPVWLADDALIYMLNVTIRNTADKAAVHTGEKSGGTHDVFWINPVFDQDDESNPTIQAGLYVDNSGGSIQVLGGDILHQHNNIWLNPGRGQMAIWLFGSMVTSDTADFDRAPRGGVGIKITPHDGGAANGNVFSNSWASTADPGVLLLGDAASSCSGNQFVQLQALHNRGAAVVIDHCDRTTLGFPMIAGASTTTPGRQAAVEIGAGAGAVSIIGGVIGEGDGFPATQSHNIKTAAGYVGDLVIKGVDLRASIGKGFVAAIDMKGPPSRNSVVSDAPGFSNAGLVDLTKQVTSSPWTYQSGLTRESVQFEAESVRAEVDGISVCARSPCNFELNPGQTMIVSYTGYPRALSNRH